MAKRDRDEDWRLAEKATELAHEAADKGDKFAADIYAGFSSYMVNQIEKGRKGK